MESVYAAAMVRELVARGHQVGREVAVAIRYKGEVIARQRLDMIVDERCVVELKSGPEIPAFALPQLLSYLKASRIAVGLLLHFGPRAAVRRVIRDR